MRGTVCGLGLPFHTYSYLSKRIHVVSITPHFFTLAYERIDLILDAEQRFDVGLCHDGGLAASWAPAGEGGGGRRGRSVMVCVCVGGGGEGIDVS